MVTGLSPQRLAAPLCRHCQWSRSGSQDDLRHTSALPAAERKPELAEAAWKEVAPALDVLETALTKSEWLAGPAFSVGDLNVAAALYRALFIDLAKWPHVQAWLKRCWERPAAKRVRAMRE